MNDAVSLPGNTEGSMLDVHDLSVEFAQGGRKPSVRAVDDVSFSVSGRETVGLVGESGSGKSTIGRAILGLLPVKTGTISFNGTNVIDADYRARRILSRDLQVVFQDPYSSLNPARTIGQTLGEMLIVHGRMSRTAVTERVVAMLDRVGLSADATSLFPSDFSGGQRQRIAIARALMVQPRLVICDEPVSALDLSVQAQVLNLLRDLQSELAVSYLFISHDLAVVRYLCHRIVVLYRGRVMEHGIAATVYDTPAHPYTQALLDAVPIPDPSLRSRQSTGRRINFDGLVPEVQRDGCPFAPRCPHRIEKCSTTVPHLELTPAASQVACHRWRELGSRKVVGQGNLSKLSHRATRISGRSV